jgi:hypothetical protein
VAVKLTDEQAKLIQEALEATVTLCTLDEAVMIRADELLDEAYLAICKVLGVTPKTISPSGASQREPEAG